MQEELPYYASKNGTLVAISPEIPDTSLSTIEKHELKFRVLSDKGNEYAKELGILCQQPDELRPVFELLGNDLKKRNGDDSFAVPVPAAVWVGGDGAVKNIFVEPDFAKRVEPEVVKS